MTLAVSPAVAPPRVTAIIIVLNGEAFIDEAIASVAAQSFPNWELLVIDDGSTDGTIERVQRRLAADPRRIRLLRHSDHGNHGMSATRNLGLSEARGEFVGFLDADDVWQPEKLAEQIAILEQSPIAAMVYGRTLIWHEWDDCSKHRDFSYDLGVEPDRTYPPPLLFRQLLRNVHQTPTTCNALLRREAVAAVGGFDPAFRTLFEDQIFFAKILLDFPVHVAGRCWAKYRQHAGGTAQSASDSHAHRDHMRYLRALRVHLRQRGHRISAPRRALETTIAALRLRQVSGRARRWVRQSMPR